VLHEAGAAGIDVDAIARRELAATETPETTAPTES
jgi:hypothetical protein